jgi:hypothetical protein
LQKFNTAGGAGSKAKPRRYQLSVIGEWAVEAPAIIERR